MPNNRLNQTRLLSRFVLLALLVHAQTAPITARRLRNGIDLSRYQCKSTGLVRLAAGWPLLYRGDRRHCLCGPDVPGPLVG
jgi:hypothetical protein